MEQLRTEMRNPHTTYIDRMETEEILRVMNEENRRVPEAVDEILQDLIPLVDHIAGNLPRGGRLFYAGAGTSGRIGVMDAVECPPTFGVPEGQVVALLAGGEKAMVRAVEDAEDSEEAGRRDLLLHTPREMDTVLGVSAAGGAAYVMGVLKAAREAGSATACLCCNRGVPLLQWADFAICPDTGPEVITGSTRLKAGTAQKLILNLISTAVMVKTGKVYENYMIHMRPTNKKLKKRALHILSELTEKSEEETAHALEQAGGDLRQAVEALQKEE